MLYLHEATVEVGCHFPLDMLRYDSCFPATEQDSVKIAESIRGFSGGPWTVHVQALSQNKSHWTPARWQSFGARLIEGPSRKA